MEPRELALREVRDNPWLQQRELAARLAGQTGLAESTLIRLFRRMEADGELRSGLDGRRKTYALPPPPPAPEPVPTGPPSSGALWSDRLAPLGEPEAEPEPGAEPEPEPGAEPRPARPEPVGTRPAWPIAAVVAVVLIVSVLAAWLLSPERYDPLADHEDENAKPVKASTPASAPQKGAKAKPGPAPAAAKVRVAVLSGVPEAGAAAKEAKRLKARGVPIGAVGNAPAPAERSAVLYARGQRAAAREVSEQAGIASVKAIDSQTAEPARGAKLVVVVGTDR